MSETISSWSWEPPSYFGARQWRWQRITVYYELVYCVRKQLPPPSAAVFENVTWEHNSAVRYFFSYRFYKFGLEVRKCEDRESLLENWAPKTVYWGIEKPVVRPILWYAYTAAETYKCLLLLCSLLVQSQWYQVLQVHTGLWQGHFSPSSSSHTTWQKVSEVLSSYLGYHPLAQKNRILLLMLYSINNCIFFWLL